MIFICEAIVAVDTAVGGDGFKYHWSIGSSLKLAITRHINIIHIRPIAEQTPTSIEYAYGLGNQFAMYSTDVEDKLWPRLYIVASNVMYVPPIRGSLIRAKKPMHETVIR